MYDWKKPLYQSAVDAMEDMDLSSFRRIAEYFRLLGNYKDSAALYKRCLLFPREFFDTVMEDLRAARSEFELNAAGQKIDDLRKTIGEETFQNEEWQDRQKTYEKLLVKKERKVFVIEHQKAILLGGLVALMALTAIISGIYRNVHPGFLVFQGDQAFKNGNYGAAVAYYIEAEEENRDYRRDGDFLEKLDKAREYAGKESMEKGDLSAAADYLMEAGTEDTTDEVRLALASRLTEQGDYSQAIDVLRQTKDPGAVSARLTDLYQKRAKKQTQAMLQMQEQNPKAVHKLAGEIDDVDGLLSFVKAAVDAGYDPYDAFSGSFDVRNLAMDYDFSKKPKTVPDAEKVLVVYRIQRPYNTMPAGLMQSVVQIQQEPFITEIGLWLSALYSVDERYRAESLSECTAILLVNSWYSRTETVKGVFHNTAPGTKNEEYKIDYCTYERHDEIYLCGREPETFLLLAEKVNAAPIFTEHEDLEEDPPLYEYTEQDLLKTADVLLGQPDTAWINTVVNEAISQINHQEE